MKAYQGTSNPSGDGGYKSSGKASTCPTESQTWQVSDFKNMDLPGMPSGAQKYMKDGAGKGPGINGKGSHFDTDSGTATASVAMGSSTSTGSASASGDDDDDSGAASLGFGALYVSAAATLFTLVGTLLL